MRTSFLLAPALSLLLTPLASAQGAPEILDRIVEEGTENSQVWATLMYLSEEIGPRLTGSTNLQRANGWTRDEFTRLGLKNVHLDRWGELPVRFDRGPCSARLVEPEVRDFEFTARAWSAGTDGPVRGPVLMYPTTEEELEAVSGQWEGAWLLSKSRRRGRRGGSDEGEGAELREKIEEVKELSRVQRAWAMARKQVTEIRENL